MKVSEVETDVPLPPAQGEKGSAPRSALGKAIGRMGNGQSFLTTMNRQTVYSLARYYSIKVTIRKQPDGQLRVWRIAEFLKPTKPKETKCK